MKKAILVIVLGLLWCNTGGAVNTKPGSGELKLSENVVRNFYNHINYKTGKPYIFLVTADGKNSSSWYCAYTQCTPSGAFEEASKCERYHGKKCYVFALGGSVKWKNQYRKKIKGKKRRFTKKDSLETMKSKLQVLGFYDYDDGTEQKQKKIEKKKTKTVKKSDQDITEKLKELNELYKSGVLTKEEFEKAKKKLLN